MEPAITWYEVLGILPGADAGKIRRKYEERVALLRGEMIAGAPSNVLIVIRRAQEFLDGAWEVLGNPAVRERYDVAAGFRRQGGGPSGSRGCPFLLVRIPERPFRRLRNSVVVALYPPYSVGRHNH